MIYKRFEIQIVARVILLLANLILLAWLIIDFSLLFTIILLAVLLVAQVWELIYFANRTNRELQKFFEAVRYQDLGTRFKLEGLGATFESLQSEFKHFFETLKGAKADQQSKEELLQLILQNINLGVIVVDSRERIFLLNEKALETLDIPQFSSWQRLKGKRPALALALGDLRSSGRRIINLVHSKEPEEILVDLDHITLGGEKYHLITLTDLRSEIEQKEIEAWHKLIRILAHEVMNSVTPVVSLSETLGQMVVTPEGRLKKPAELQEEDLTDIHEALQTIRRRSKGMLTFVEDYRKLTKLPAPSFEVVGIKALFTDLAKLMEGPAREYGISIQLQVAQPRLAVKADKKMLEQVLINLMKNAISALSDSRGGEIILSARLEEEYLAIAVSDNGPGIEDAIKSQIFIPFFSTRKNGTGIGLTLSKNIMKLHGGDIEVSSEEGQGTTFTLHFIN